MCENEKEQYKMPYSDEWLEQHKEYQYKRFIKELKRREEEEKRKPYIIRIINKIIGKIQFYWIDIIMGIRIRFDKNMREEIESIINELDDNRNGKEQY